MTALSKRVVESRTKDLPVDVAERLRGFNGDVNQLGINLMADDLRNYLREKYGPNVSAWLPPLQIMLNNQGKPEMTSWKLAAVKRVIKEVNGTER